MWTHSIYVFSCVCGRKLRTATGGAFRCPDCGRLLVVDWRPAAVEDAEADRSEGGLPVVSAFGKNDPV
jgi:DNA-directed RNA polymerase subunit RPC12/RpoP